MLANSSHNGSFAGSEERWARHELKAYDINGSSSGFCFTSIVPVRIVNVKGDCTTYHSAPALDQRT